MTQQKRWVAALGDPGQEPADTGELLKQTSDKRKRREIERQEEIDEMEHEAKKAELEKKKKTAEADVEKVEGREKDSGTFKVTGGVNLGNYDVQEMQRESQNELRRMKDEQEKNLREMGQLNEQLRDRIHEQELKVLQITFQAQMDALTRALESNKASQKSLSDMLTEARETAKAIGMAEPQAGGDASIQIELKKLDFEHQIELRRLSREEKKSDRDFQLQLRKLDDDRDQRKYELEQQRRSQEIWANAPAQLGSAIARGIIDQEQQTRPKGEGSRRVAARIEAGHGQSGEVPCPFCETPVGVGPTAKTAECVQCGEKFNIARVGGETTAGE